MQCREPRFLSGRPCPFLAWRFPGASGFLGLFLRFTILYICHDLGAPSLCIGSFSHSSGVGRAPVIALSWGLTFFEMFFFEMFWVVVLLVRFRDASFWVIEEDEEKNSPLGRTELLGIE
ncbi:uncharacterized protein K489DRAFT_81827 [Dissoconium aciculare CBS 342.82]|jgi:hypothetical protein|uniref:Uncharacterized protein n=1 Tax=Dissoconium aciculare CBS 342.82 TaxID=1314786 RepID=A0A6J3LST9_9PEZI|nr:uncharacterized protein K489DRAFT_81827 [Dissoconium aciculare CBS 342.82]KAF1818860.1 hypothetical protein K489DRAFT_81827 [Dissoconium aciculare CBS 342.82]